MRILIKYWDTDQLDLQSVDFEAQIPVGSGNGMAAATPSYIDMGHGNPKLSGKSLSGTQFTFRVQLSATADSDLEVQRDILNGWFRPDDFTFRKLVGFDVDDSNKEWYLEGFPVTAPMLVDGAVKNMYNITLALKEPYWIESDLQTDTWTINTNTDTHEIIAAGNVPALPIFEITPGSPKTGDSADKRRFYAVHTHDTPDGMGLGGLFAVDLTNGAGLDTSGSEFLDSGDDLLVNVDGVSADRWFGKGGINSATTSIWVNLYFQAMVPMFAIGALDGSTTPATWEIEYQTLSIKNEYLPTAIPQNGTLLIGNELITYSSYIWNQGLRRITFTLTERASKGSSIAAHTQGTSVFWIQHEIWMTHNNPSAPTFIYNNENNKPAFDLTDSTPTSRVYYTFGGDTERTLSPIKSNGGGGVNYTGAEGATASPATEIGLQLSSTLNGNQVISNTSGWCMWTILVPEYTSHIVANGQKYRSGDLFPANCFLGIGSYSPPYTFSVIASPSVIATWEPITIDVDTLFYGYPMGYIDFGMWGGLGTSFPVPTALAELQDVTLTLSYPPVVFDVQSGGGGASQSNYSLAATLENTETGDQILFNDLITATGNLTTVDCNEQEVYSADGKRVRGMIGFAGNKRDEWLTLVPGSNTLSYSDTGTASIEIVTKWRGRNTL